MGEVFHENNLWSSRILLIIAERSGNVAALESRLLPLPDWTTASLTSWEQAVVSFAACC